MLRGLGRWLGERFGPATDDEADRRFVPSTLDRSVLFAHGSPKDEVDSEVASVAQRARELEENRRK